MNDDEKWMKLAIKQANLAMLENEIPVGSVLVHKNQLVSSAHNQPISKNDPTAHAEIQALKAASIIKNNYRLIDSTLYVSLEPCAMCFGAMIHARIKRVVFGAHDTKSGVCGSCINLQDNKIFNHRIEVTGGILEEECKELMQSFFKKLRKPKNHFKGQIKP